jgi:hypothetical protein
MPDPQHLSKALAACLVDHAPTAIVREVSFDPAYRPSSYPCVCILFRGSSREPGTYSWKSCFTLQLAGTGGKYESAISELNRLVQTIISRLESSMRMNGTAGSLVIEEISSSCRRDNYPGLASSIDIDVAIYTLE